MFLLHNDLPSVISIHHRRRFVCMTLIHWLLTLNRSLFGLFVVICFLVICFLSCLLTKYWFVSFQQHMCHWSCLLCIYDCWLTLNRSLFRFYCIWHCLLTRHWFVQCQQHLYIGVTLQYNSGSMAATFNNSPFQQVYFSLGYCVFTSF